VHSLTDDTLGKGFEAHADKLVASAVAERLFVEDMILLVPGLWGMSGEMGF